MPDGVDSHIEGRVPLVFFYRGPRLPSYANVSLSRARAAWSGPIVLLHDQDSELSVDGTECETFLPWYDPTKFEAFKRASDLDESFRSGFWFHATERLFVIEQWLLKTGRNKFAHAELDVDVSCRSDQMNLLDTWGTGLFYPFGTHEHAGASFMYCNEPQALARLIQHISRAEHSGDEMHALWDFGVLNPSDVHVLPSHTFFEAKHPDLARLSFVPPDHVGGLFDVQPLGTWLFGQDPRNARRDPDLNHFLFEEIGPASLNRLRFRYEIRRGQVSVRSKTSRWMRILALHIHSKNFGFVANRLVGLVVVAVANLSFRVPLSFRNLDRFAHRKLRAIVDYFYIRVKDFNSK